MSGNGAPDLSQKLTEAVKEFFQTNSRLKIVNPGDPEPADLVLSGEITSYDVIPVGYSGDGQNEAASLNRLRVNVLANLELLREIDEDGYEVGYENKTFQNTNAEFSSDDQFADKENDLVDEVVKQLSQELFTKAFSSW